jgi:3-hydroxyacyl-CoA dehydrogenase
MSGSAERRAEIEKTARKALKRMTDADPAAASFHVYGAAEAAPADIIIECMAEDVAVKRTAIDAVASRLTERTIVASCSSSILPDRLHPRCVGLHFFYPVELTGTAEFITRATLPEVSRAAVREFAAEADLSLIEQDERTAFAVNRLLLPLQVEAARALLAGLPAAAVDRATTCDALPLGQLQLMDAVGLDVIHAAAVNYLTWLPENDAADYAPLFEVLSRLSALGKRGRKNGDGFLLGAPLPWRAIDNCDESAWRSRFRLAFANTCARFAATGLLDAPAFSRLFSHILQTDIPAAHFFARELNSANRTALAQLYRDTRLSYFGPDFFDNRIAFEAAK